MPDIPHQDGPKCPLKGKDVCCLKVCILTGTFYTSEIQNFFVETTKFAFSSPLITTSGAPFVNMDWI